MTVYQEAYREQTAKLDKLHACGLDDSPECDALLDEMDGVWWALQRANRLEARAMQAAFARET